MEAIKLCRLDTPIIFIEARINLSRFVVTGCAAKTSATVTFPSLNLISLFAFFFFSCRRRHTRCLSDWSSDVCSSDLWKEPDLLRTVTVRPDGKITFPLIGDVQAAGRTPRGLTDEIAKALAKYIKEPVVTVIVEEINNYQVFVLGEVGKQGALSLRRKTRFLEAIAMAGGLTTYADKGNVTLLRYDGSKESRTRIDYRKVV